MTRRRSMTNRIIDAWMQQPTERMSAHEMFASLRRWTAWPSAITPQMTIASMDRGRRVRRTGGGPVRTGWMDDFA
jgi:hypothetical protein